MEIKAEIINFIWIYCDVSYRLYGCLRNNTKSHWYKSVKIHKPKAHIDEMVWEQIKKKSVSQFDLW